MSLSRSIPPTTPSTEFAQAYWPAFRKHIMTMIQIAHARLDRSSLRMAVEEDITGELKREIEVWLDEEAPDWANAYAIHEDPRIHAQGRRGKHRRRVDLRFEHTGTRPRPHYEFESKRLCKGHSGVSDYLGTEGMALFLDGEYARRWPEAGMLGYIQTNDAKHWADKLSEKLAACTASTEDGAWQATDIVDGIATYRSCHPRCDELDPIRVFHVLLDMS